MNKSKQTNMQLNKYVVLSYSDDGLTSIKFSR